MTSTLGVLEGVPGIVTREELAVTAAHLASLQTDSGQIPWFVGGHCDPWNHVEAAMALTVTGYVNEARAAYLWLGENQLGDGSWFNYYVEDRVKDTRLDTNVCAYIAAGVYHYVVATNDDEFGAAMWPAVRRAIEFVLRWQMDDGTVRWSLDARGRPESYALLTGSVRWRSANGWATRDRTGNCARGDSVTRSPTTRAPSRPRTSSPWTGTTQSSRERSSAKPARSG
jgi:hypothetical protein